MSIRKFAEVERIGQVLNGSIRGHQLAYVKKSSQSEVRAPCVHDAVGGVHGSRTEAFPLCYLLADCAASCSEYRLEDAREEPRQAR